MVISYGKSCDSGSQLGRRSAPSQSDPVQSDYNATVVSIRRCHDDLMVLRVSTDTATRRLQAGKHTVLGLGSWEPRIAGVQREAPYDRPQLIKRAYSISSPMLDDEGGLLRIEDLPWLEFYIVLVRQARERPPALTPRLFALRPGARLYCSPNVRGRYTLDRVASDQNVVLMATGAGEAPHNAMVAELLSRAHRGKVLAVTCARYDRDLPYADVHRRLEQRFSNYRYLPLTTRESRNTDKSRSDYVGKRYLQAYLDRGDLELEGGFELDPKTTHVFLCGSPEMIGAPQRRSPSATRYPITNGMVELLEKRGFVIDRPHEPGNLHFELYW